MWIAREKSEYFFRDILPEECFTDEAAERREEQMKRIQQVTENVRVILEKYPETRNSDNALFIKVVEHINKDLIYLPIVDLLLNAEEYNIPRFESVRRARQKLQAENSHLRACKEVQEARAENEESVREYVTDCPWR